MPGSENPWHHVSSPRSSRGTIVGRQLGRGVVDHRRRQHLGHRVDAGLDEVAGGERLAEVGPQQRRAAEAADPLGPAPAHPAGVVGEPLHLRQVRHLLVERAAARVVGARARRRARRASASSDGPELVELHRCDRPVRARWAAGRVGSWARPESRAPLLRRNVIDRVCSRQPSVGAAVGVGVPADAHVVGRLLDEAQRLLAGAGVAVELERRRARPGTGPWARPRRASGSRRAA